LVIVCAALVLRPFACNQGSISTEGTTLGRLAMNAAVAYDSSNGTLSLRGDSLKLAGGTFRFDGTLRSPNWSLAGSEQGLDLASARRLLQPWFQLPEGDSLTGHVELRLSSTGTLDPTDPPGNLQADFTASTSDLNYSNQPGTTVGQSVATS